MEKLVRPLNRCCCCRYRGSRGSEPFFLAVYKNNLDEFRSLVESGISPNAKSERGNTLLNYIIEHERFEIFDYFLRLEGIDINTLDTIGRSPLLYSAGDFDDYFALELIKYGANIHLEDDQGCTFLHLAARRTTNDHLRVGQLIIEKGGDVNAQNRAGETPLYIACKRNNFNWVYMLLYYGALATIPCNKGILPIAVAALPHLQKILMEYSFDGDTINVRLPTLVVAMTQESPLFQKIFSQIGEVSYGIDDLKYLCDNLIHLRAVYFRQFIQQFGNIVKEMIENFPPLTRLLEFGPNLEHPEVKDILYAFFDSNYVMEFVQSSNPSYSTIAHFIRMFNKPEMFVKKEELTKIVCLMLTYGVNVTSEDLDTVYHYYGHCRLFKMLLHMEIEMVDVGNNGYGMAALYYIPNISFEAFPDDASLSYALLSYYNHPRLKELCLNCDEEIISNVTRMPSVPYLMELSRNATKKYIIERYHIHNSRQFYTILNWLPISYPNI